MGNQYDHYWMAIESCGKMDAEADQAEGQYHKEATSIGQSDGPRFQEESFIRVGNSTRRLSDCEIYSFISSRTQPKFDAEPILEATLEGLDRGKLKEYLSQQRKARPSAPYWSRPFEQVR